MFTNKKAFNVYWVNGDSIESFTARYTAIAQLAQLEIQGLKPSEVCLAVKTWLESEHSKDWLLCVDNADKLTDAYVESIQSYLPRSKGVIVFTSRDGSIGSTLVRLECCVELEASMTKDEAITTFESALGALDNLFDDTNVEHIVRRLDYLPLAIVQAAAYVRQNRVTMDQYLHRLEKSEHKLLAVPLREVDHPPRAVMTTWKVSYDYIRSQNTSATDLLDIMSCLDFQEIQRTLLCSEKLTTILAIDDIDFDVAMGLLQSFALISLNSGPSCSNYRMHRLVSSWTLENIERKGEVIKTALQIVSTAFEEYTMDKMLQYKALLPHVEAILRHTVATSELQGDRISLLSDAAHYYDDAGQWSMSEQYFNECLLFRETNFGLEHPSTLGTVNNMASVYDNQGRYDEALEWYGRVLI